MTRCAIFAAALALVSAGAAGASGGASIKTAPTLRSGVKESVNTKFDETSNGKIGSDASLGCWIDVEYYRLPLVAGDKVAITGAAIAPGYEFQVGIFPAGTTDASLERSATLKNALANHGVIHFKAPKTGTYPLVVGPNCYNGEDGPFTFTVTVAK